MDYGQYAHSFDLRLGMGKPVRSEELVALGIRPSRCRAGGNSDGNELAGNAAIGLPRFNAFLVIGCAMAALAAPALYGTLDKNGHGNSRLGTS